MGKAVKLEEILKARKIVCWVWMYELNRMYACMHEVVPLAKHK